MRMLNEATQTAGTLPSLPIPTSSENAWYGAASELLARAESDEPAAGNDTDEGRFKNRRVEFRIIKRDDSLKKAPEGDAPPDIKK